MLIRVGLALKDKGLLRYLEKKLADADVRVEVCGPPRRVWQNALRSGFDVIVISESFVLRPVDNGIAILNELPESPTTIIIYDSDSLEEHAHLSAAGADVVLYAGLSKNSLFEAIDTALESRRQFIQHKRYDRRGVVEPKMSDFVMESPAMQVFMEEVHQVIPSDSPILLTGETGVGKEHLAKAIHAQSPRSVGPFISINMAAMPENLLESELFGHEKGAFTGAHARKKGRFEIADGGTLFMDEIGELPVNLQVKLLRVLQEKNFERVGGVKPLAVDIRIIAATNRRLREEMARGRFREDLYYRLNVVHIGLPPLRQRKEDIRLLMGHFIKKYAAERHDRAPVTGVSPEVDRLLDTYHWPGNVRELENVIERAMILCPGDTLQVEDLPGEFRDSLANTLRLEGIPADARLYETLARVERQMIVRALRMAEGVQSRAAEMLGIGKSGLNQKLKKYGLDVAAVLQQDP